MIAFSPAQLALLTLELEQYRTNANASASGKSSKDWQVVITEQGVEASWFRLHRGEVLVKIRFWREAGGEVRMAARQRVGTLWPREIESDWSNRIQRVFQPLADRVRQTSHSLAVESSSAHMIKPNFSRV